jgi:methyl-accepting chemotaxis protein
VILKTAEIRDSATEQSRATEAMAQAAETMSAQIHEEDVQIQLAHGVISDLEKLASELRGIVGSFRL